MSLRDKFSSENPYALPIIMQTAQTNAAALNAILIESDQLASTSAFIRQNALTANPANPVPLVTNVASQTIDVAIGDGAVLPDGQPNPRPPISPIQD